MSKLQLSLTVTFEWCFYTHQHRTRTHSVPTVQPAAGLLFDEVTRLTCSNSIRDQTERLYIYIYIYIGAVLHCIMTVTHVLSRPNFLPVGGKCATSTQDVSTFIHLNDIDYRARLVAVVEHALRRCSLTAAAAAARLTDPHHPCPPTASLRPSNRSDQ